MSYRPNWYRLTRTRRVDTPRPLCYIRLDTTSVGRRQMDMEGKIAIDITYCVP